MVTYVTSDLEFILDQILIAEAHALHPETPLSELLPNVQVPFGLRTVDGSFNNLVSGQGEFGAADNIFGRLLDPVFNPAEAATSYAQTNGFVIDSQPRTISNLIVDQTANNPAAVAANGGAPTVTSPGLDGIFGTPDDREVFFIPNSTPDAGLSAPFNAWMTFFGQFFDHGLDLVSKGGSGTIFIPLQPDDPLFNPAPGAPNFMVLTRATNQPGADGVLGTADDVHEHTNTTSPFVDQNQTYSSHSSHQVFLRAYEASADGPRATGELITNRNLGADGAFGTADDAELGGMATWGVLKAQARDLLGINLTDTDVFNVPLLAADAYGNFLKGQNGFPQVVMRTAGADGIFGTADDGTELVEGNPAAPLDLTNAVRTGHAFLEDIAHSANPVGDHDGNPGTPNQLLTADADTDVGGTPALGFYDDELLDAHYMAGDGRVNENIGLTAVHAVFHSEHNRLVEHTKEVALASGDLGLLNAWLLTPVAAIPTTPGAIAALEWNGERLFQAAKFGTEMQYQHLVFEEFARTIQPQVDAFLAPNGYDTTIDASIVAEFAHTVYRFGHSMLTETVDRFDPDFTTVNGETSQMGLIAAFLNPLAFANSGPTSDEATGAIVRGLTRQAGNEIDEFVTEALRNNLVGLPLDLPALNIARGRDTGIPSLNEARREFFEMTGDTQLKAYTSWADLTHNLKHAESVINFIAAYGTHAALQAADVNTLAEMRDVALALVFGGSAIINAGAADERLFTADEADRLDFLNSTGIYANLANGATTTGVDDIDFWIGGLAEKQMPFGGMLGSTFNFVFETQLEALQDGDRFYYLSRTAGMHFGTELEQNSFAKLVMENSNATHLSGQIFQTPDFILEVDASQQFTGLGTDGRDDPTGGIFIGNVEITPLVIRDNPGTAGPDSNYLQYTGGAHVVLGGTANNDILIAGDGDDTLYGDGGNDRLEGGYGNDTLLGGAGDDIIQDMGGDDKLDGGDGNDVIQAGNMAVGGVGNLIFGGKGNDFIIMTEDFSTTFGGEGDDFILGAKTNLPSAGNEGDDWIEKGTQDGAPGDNLSALLLDDVIGNDIFIGGGGFDEMIGEGGDDIFVGSDAQDKMEGMSGFDWVTYKNDRWGVTADLTLPALAQPHGDTPISNIGPVIAVGASPASILDRFAEVEGLSGSAHGDILRGDDIDAVTILNHGGATGGALTNVDLIDGLRELLGGADGFATGNIILGGAGSDIIEGRGGDDLIDGDRALNVRISVRANADGTGPEIASFDSMEPMIPLMLNGTYSAGQLKAVREITDVDDQFDTAVFSGNLIDYQWLVNDNGTADTSDDVVTISHLIDDGTGVLTLGADGTDTLKNIERLQFNDQSWTLSGDNFDPQGQIAVSDGTPEVGQLLTASIAGVTDDDNVSATNPTGAITSPVSYIWQVDRLGDGIFEDIVLLEAGDLAFQSANGRSFSVTPDLAGLALRVKAIFQDTNGVTETVFSAATAAVVAGPVVAPVVPVAGPETVEAGEGVNLVRSDLNFILNQIKIAEAQTNGADILDLIPNVRAALGLRTVDGSFNNLMPGQEHFGAADNVFPRLSDPHFDTAENVTIDLDGPGPQTVGSSTSYAQNSGFVFDSQPRTISNLIVDQTANNPAAYANAYDAGLDGVLHTADDELKDGVHVVVSPGLDGQFGTTDDKEVFQFDNVAPDDGLSAPFNAWMTFFGQFFDHGLDLVTKGGSGTIFIPLKPDDPLYVEGSQTNFMVLTRATNQPGADGVLGTADDVHEHMNTTSPFVDQNQTYSSHPSHQVFLRSYVLNGDGEPVATGRLITGRDLGADGQYGTADDVEIGGMATWAVVKAQARDILGINLTDANYNNVPLLATDAYGNFIKGPNGFPQVVFPGNVLVEGDPLANGGLGISITGAVQTGHAFLDDIAHFAVPVGDHDGNPATPSQLLTPDADLVAGGPPPATGSYDNELLDAHYIAGDGRVNENIGLTAVHAVFHSEHNRLVEQVKGTVLASQDAAFLAEWLAPGTAPATFPVTQAEIDALQWNGERLFQTAKFGTEMQYQHLVFEEFARVIQPNVDLFFAPTQVYDVDLDPSIVAEFAHTVYRFGHSMLTETVDRYDPEFTLVDGTTSQIGLIAAFLNPLAFADSGPTPEAAAGAIVRGVTRQAGNEIDEFVTEALRNNLVGLPLDLPAINIARGRDTGMPSFNEARRDFYQLTGDSQLKPYTSWADLVQSLKHPESLINFIAAYGTHETILSATTLDAKRAAATLLVLGGDDAPADRFDFLNGTGAWANTANGVTITGVDDIDFWIGGLAEEIMPFGGMLGSTFNFVFETQLEKLQDADRFYYLERTAGLNFNAELESNSFAKMIMANTDATHLPGIVFTTPGYILEVDQSKQFNTGLGSDDPTEGDTLLTPEVIRDNPDTVGPDSNYLEYTGDQHVVLGGTNSNDILIASEGDDTVWGDGGHDRIEGGAGNDQLRGGSGDDIITDSGGDDNIQGGDGNDFIHGGNGVNLVIGGFGNDFIVTGEDASDAIGGAGNDFILGTKANEQDMGNEGDDWMEAGTFDGAPGDNFDPLGNDPVIGNDVYIGRGENDKFNGEGGDDIMVGSPGFGDRYIGGSGFDWATFKDDAFGVTLDMTDRFFDQPPQPGSGASVMVRFDIVEGLSGSSHGDVLRGDNEDAASLRTAGATGSLLTNIALIDGLADLLAGTTTTIDGVTFFDGGNIILGGDGGDIIEGRGGNDLIDGDAWLNVRIEVTGTIDPATGAPYSFDSMEPMIPHMLSGEWNPGQLRIVREILYATGPDFDTAEFSGAFLDLGADGVLGGGDDVQQYTIADNGDGTFTVTDLVGTDGVDTLKHIERLQFTDQAIVLVPGLNAEPEGQLAIIGTPTEGQPLTVSIAGVTDADNPGGVITGAVSYYWQVDLDGVGVFEDLTTFQGGEAARVLGLTFTPTEDEVGAILRVRAVYKDANGVLEEVFSAPTAPVINVNNAPTGLPTISDTTPTQGSLLTASAAGISDLDGLTAAVFQFQWQQSDELSPTGFSDIFAATGSSFTPTQDQVGLLLRVVVTYLDDNGALETVQSVPTQVVANVNDAPEGVPVISDTSPTEGSLLTALTDSITDVDGVGTFSFQWQQSDLGGGVTFANIPGATSETFTPTQGQVNRQLQLVVTYTDAQGTIETLVSTPTGVTGDLFVGTNAADNPTLTAGDDIASGGGGNDILNGLGGNDILNGGAGIDAIDGGAGNDIITGGIGTDNLIGGDDDDIFNYTFGDGVDFLNGGTGIDTQNIFGTAGADTLDVVLNGTALTSFEGSTLTGIEAVIADLIDGTDTLSYAGTAAASSVSVNLEAGTASGFQSIAGIENVTGGTGNDSLTGNALANILAGGAGNDVLNGGLGNDTLSGGAGTDTASYAGETADMVVTLTGATGNTRRGTSALIEDTLPSIESVIGGLGNDTITTNGNANTIDGGAGNDTISSGGGNDVVSGGVGNDIIIGGDGNDTLSGDAGEDTFRFTIGQEIDTVDGGVGTDTLAILGTAAANTLDVIYTGPAITQFEGGSVTNVEAVTADMLGGNDRLSYTGTTVGVDVNLALNAASGFTSIAGIENVTGGSGADTLTGNALVNNLAGGAGNDTLDGGLGNDTLDGGLGDDTFIANLGDTITEANGVAGGIDTVLSLSNTFTITDADVENLTFFGAGDFIGTGNASSNVITGLAGNDNLSGGGGADTLVGGLGSDTLNGGAGDDRLIGGIGDDVLTGGTGNDMFAFGPADGATDFDLITAGFDAAGGLGAQDFLDLTAYGFDAAEFASNVSITDLGNDTLVRIDTTHIVFLTGVNGNGTNVITIDDFLL